MKKSIGVVLGVAVVILAVVLVTGLAGIRSKITVAEGSCSQSYPHYKLKPWLHEWLECRRQQPCGVDEGIEEYNAKAAVAQCLCNDSTVNTESIIDFYNREIVAEFVTEPQPSNDIEFICTQGTLPVGRL